MGGVKIFPQTTLKAIKAEAANTDANEMRRIMASRGYVQVCRLLQPGFEWARAAPIYGVSLLLAYGAGHCAVIVAAGTSTEMVQGFLNWNEQSKGVAVLKIICGGLVLLGGCWLIYTAGAAGA